MAWSVSTPKTPPSYGRDIQLKFLFTFNNNHGSNWIGFRDIDESVYDLKELLATLIRLPTELSLVKLF